MFTVYKFQDAKPLRNFMRGFVIIIIACGQHVDDNEQNRKKE